MSNLAVIERIPPRCKGSIRRINDISLLDRFITDLKLLESEYKKEYEVLWIQQTGTAEIPSFYSYKPSGYITSCSVNFILERYNSRQLEEMRSRIINNL